MSPAPAEWAADDAEAEFEAERRPRTFAGFKLTTIAVVVAFLALVFWNAWATRKIMALEQRQVVSVSLQTLISDFITSESRKSGNEEETAFKTKLYLTAVEKAVAELGADGTPVLVSEAVLGNSVTDATPRIKAAVDKAMGTPAASPVTGGGDGQR